MSSFTVSVDSLRALESQLFDLLVDLDQPIEVIPEAYMAGPNAIGIVRGLSAGAPERPGRLCGADAPVGAVLSWWGSSITQIGNGMADLALLVGKAAAAYEETEWRNQIAAGGNA